MTPERHRAIARLLLWVGGAIVVMGTTVMAIDYARARSRAAGDDRRIAELQVLAQGDARASTALLRVEQEITTWRAARKARTNQLSIAVLAGAILFLAGAKWLIALRGERPVAPLVFVRARPAGANAASTRHAATSAALPQATPPIDLSFVDAIVAREGTSREAAIPILQAVQAHYRYLPDEALARVCELTEVTPSQIAGTSSFYARFRRSPLGRHLVRVCHGTACHVAGARQITEELRRELAIADHADTDPRGDFTLDEVACLGCCTLAPVLMVDDQTVGRLTPVSACHALDPVRRKESA